MPLRVRQVSEHWATEILRANEEFKGFTSLVLPHGIHDMKVSQNQPPNIGNMWRFAIMYHQPRKKYGTWKTIGHALNLPPTSQEVRDLENDRGRPNSPKAYRLYNK